MAERDGLVVVHSVMICGFNQGVVFLQCSVLNQPQACSLCGDVVASMAAPAAVLRVWSGSHVFGVNSGGQQLDTTGMCTYLHDIACNTVSTRDT